MVATPLLVGIVLLLSNQRAFEAEGAEYFGVLLGRQICIVQVSGGGYALLTTCPGEAQDSSRIKVFHQFQPQTTPLSTYVLLNYGNEIARTDQWNWNARFRLFWVKADKDQAFLVLPLGALISLCMMPSLAWVLVRTLKWNRLRVRFAGGQCAGCGYDLRASRRNCPECGFVRRANHSARVDRL